MSDARATRHALRTPFSPTPQAQRSWDWRAATNFIAGGAGSGVVVATVAADIGAARGTLLLALGLVLVGAGLLSVWLEIGRPRRALNVFLNPRRSWMAREALAASALFPAGAAAVLGVPGIAALAGLVALAFLYCQARILNAARGIAAWREPRVIPLIVATGITEGLGLAVAVDAPLGGRARPDLAVALALFLLLRAGTWHLYRRRVARSAPAGSVRALDDAAPVLQLAGTLLPLALLAVAAGGVGHGAATAAAALAGLAAASAGGYLKYVLVTRAAWHQGFALPRWPVRGRAH